MPRIGGEADKFGNRYESLWTVDAALDLVDGEWSDLIVEPIGDEGAGIEFVRTDHSRGQEYHSIKRQQGDGNWTIIRLTKRQDPTGRSILGDLVRKIQEGNVGVFSSGTSASDLEELIVCAKSSNSIDEFHQRLNQSARRSGEFVEKFVPVCGDDEAAYDALKRLRVRTKNEPELTRDVERRIRSLFQMGNGQPLDAPMVRLLIGDFVTGRLGQRLTAESFFAELTDHGVLRSQLAGDTAVGDRMRQLNHAHLREVNAQLINRTRISRQESAAATTALLDRDKSVMIEGVGGGGKSCVLAQVLERLMEQDIPCLVIRLDRLTEADQSAQAIGTSRGLPKSSVIQPGRIRG